MENIADWRALPASQRRLVLAAIDAEAEALRAAIREAQGPELVETKARELAQLEILTAEIRGEI